MATAGVINGTILAITFDGTKISEQISCSISFSHDPRTWINKDSGGWEKAGPGKKSWEASGEADLALDAALGFVDLYDALVDGTEVNLEFTTGITGDIVLSGAVQVLKCDLEAGTEENAKFSFAFIGSGSPRKIGVTPFTSDALFWLDGTIDENMFIDKSGNDRNFIINNKDFEADWSEGFPYKSAATISAPAGDAVLIAADINNYLYDSGGTPNEIPVVSLYQDIDYEHKLFCRHSDQLLDGDGVETYEPRVMDMVLYDTVKSGEDLTTCQAYYFVPIEETAAVKWVAKDGNDTTGDGTKSNPFLTISKAYAGLSGNTVYVKSGVYTENTSGLGYFNMTTSNTMMCIGFTTLKATSASYVINVRTGVDVISNIHNAIIDSEATASSCIATYPYSGLTVNMIGCAFVNMATYAVRNNAVTIINMSNCISNDASTKYVQCDGDTTIDTCYFKNTIIRLPKPTSVLNSKLINTVNASWTIYSQNGELSVKGCHIESKGHGINCIAGAMASSSAVYITYNKFYINDLTGAGSLYGVYIGGAGSKYNVNVLNNEFYQTETGALSSTIGYGVYIEDQVAPEVCNNLFNIYTTSNFSAITHKFTGAVISGVNKINYNKVLSNALNGSIITIGAEDGHDEIANGSEIIGNYVQGYKKDAPLSDGQIHGILANCGINMSIKYNYVGHCSPGIVVKTGVERAYTSNGVYYNVLVDNTYAIWVRGVSGLNIFGNTITGDAQIYHYPFVFGIYADENTAQAGDQNSSNIIIKNNIISMADTGSAKGISLNEGADVGSEVENCLIYGGKYKMATDTDNYLTVTAAQVDGWLVDSFESDPLLIGNIPQAGSAAIDGGQTLAAAYDDGISAITAWENGAFPIVTTKQQSIAWDIGAYVK